MARTTPARAVMLQGTGSNVGKSLLVAGLCRAARARGLRVLPFKAQNMSNNAARLPGGALMAGAQALQAFACGVEPDPDMNPVLLAPASDRGAEVVVQGRPTGTMTARDYMAHRADLLARVLESFNRLRARADLVIVEGAGSPAEVNLRAGDIANMGFARAAGAAGVPVVLVGDIDRGGVIAQLAGTRAVLDPGDAAMIAGFIVNRFRGDPALFEEGYHLVAGLTGWRGLGVVPWFDDAALLPAEDTLDLAGGAGRAGDVPLVACLVLPRIAGFADLDALKLEPGVRVLLVRPGEVIPGNTAVVIVPDCREPLAALAFLRAQGWDVDLAAHRRRGGRVLGIGSGLALLGERIEDAATGETGQGLGLLRVETVLDPLRVRGADVARPFAMEGARSPDRAVEGTLAPGVLADDGARAAWLARIGAAPSGLAAGGVVDGVLDRLAAHLEAHLDVEAILMLAASAQP